MSSLNHSKICRSDEKIFWMHNGLYNWSKRLVNKHFMMSIFESWVYWNCIMLQNVEDAVHIVT